MVAKQLFVPGMLFENMGILYLGPVDGHDTAAMVKVLKEASRLQGPVLVHVITKKGKGYGFRQNGIRRDFMEQNHLTLIPDFRLRNV